ncbi:ribose-phosphate pyrophosphokinase [Tistlia consotensis]|uniref:ribose-phosphate diphosphokinase n=1 Tax=Tistlia consotensis USBA 355 TaxID=560819 RepID=A0A1Y6B3S4_9PROT|nr:ribose-phosphate diphosphokinase [Tistlia consotensis]SME90009.1 ribose-phosphate pyrophosphokinase [Tistlia consotensis USBA 355]SNR26491.1 ribose-phosphate pyrophosphokinase [Tistlia consotensis]
MKLFALDASRAFGEAVADALGLPLAAQEERAFEDGEHKVRPLEGVRGADVYVVQGLHGGPDQSVHDKLCRLLFFLACLRDQGAARLTAVVPYLAYGRKDRRTKPRDPVTTRYVAQLFEAVGLDRVVTLEVHNVVAFENAFRCETVHLDTRPIFAPLARALAAGGGEIVVASPDPGGVKRAQLFREYLEADLGRPLDGAFLEKRRSAGVVSGERVVGEVEGRTVLVIDDLISTGGTMARAARACRALGAREVHALAAHGLFVGEAAKALAEPDLGRTVVTDSVPPFRLPPALLAERVQVVAAAPLFAAALRRLHEGGSISELMAPPD